MMWYYGGPASGFGWLGMTISMLLFWAVVIGLLVWGIRRFQPVTSSNPLSILNERFAKGEIDREEYEQRKSVLEGR